jgi:hypothetical protein
VWEVIFCLNGLAVQLAAIRKEEMWLCLNPQSAATVYTSVPNVDKAL